jgi:hypothetical protein
MTLGDGMEKQGKKAKRSMPKELLRIFWSFIIIFCVPGAIITFVSPAFTVELTRVAPDRVDASVSKNLLFIVPVSRETVTGVVETELTTITGDVIRRSGTLTSPGRASTGGSTGRVVGRAEDTGILLLKGQGGGSVEVAISPKNLYEVSQEVERFIIENTESSLRLWVVSNWKFGVFLPVAILLFWIAVFLITIWTLVTGKEFNPGNKGAAAPRD